MQVSTILTEKDFWTDQWEMSCDQPLDSHTRGCLKKLILIESLIFAGVYTYIYFELTPHIYRGMYSNPFL